MATLNLSVVEPDLVALVQELSRRAGRPCDEPEARAALVGLTAAEAAHLRKATRGAPPALPLGPNAWVEVARGLEPQIAAAREVSGYYALLAERDVLASMLQSRTPAPPARDTEQGRAQAAPDAAVKSRTEPTPQPPTKSRAQPPAKTRAQPDSKPAAASDQKRGAPAVARAPAPAKSRPQPGQSSADRAAHLLGLFSYHRDNTLVAQALRISLAELSRQLDEHQLRRKAARLVRGVDAIFPSATPTSPARSGPPVRRRATVAAAIKPALPSPADELRALLAELGPGRKALAARLGPPDAPLTDKALLALFAEAGLERDFANRERDHLRKLFTDLRGHRGELARALGLSLEELKSLSVELGLARELDRMRDLLRRDARDKRWPRDRIELLLHDRAHLDELGLLSEFEREVKTRVSLLWKDLKSRPHPLEELQRALRLTEADTKVLQRFCSLRR